MIIMRKPLKKGIKRLKIIHQIYFTRKTEKNQDFFRQNVKIALNTLNQAITMIEKTGTSLQQETEDLEDEYVITIRIHK